MLTRRDLLARSLGLGAASPLAAPGLRDLAQARRPLESG